jgi:hypothetical protein
MSAYKHDFMFDSNFGFGSESVFTLADQSEIAPFPPDEGYFLLLDGTPMDLLDGEFMTLL